MREAGYRADTLTGAVCEGAKTTADLICRGNFDLSKIASLQPKSLK